jgi:hypothetical protein
MHRTILLSSVCYLSHSLGLNRLIVDDGLLVINSYLHADCAA